MISRLVAPFVDGRLTVDAGVGRRLRPLGPRKWRIEAPRERVFELLLVPYGERPPRALREKVEVWERGTDFVLAAHRTSVRGRTVTTVETVRWTRPERFDFRLVRGPVPHVAESFVLEEHEGATELTWSGKLGTDFGRAGAWWGAKVAAAWERAVEHSVLAVKAEAERRA